MNRPGGKRGEIRRTLLALALAYLFALQGLVSAVAFSCPAESASDSLETAFATALCIHADDGAASTSDHNAPAPAHSHHCLLCAAHAACDPRGDGLIASAHPWAPARAPIGRALAIASSAGPHPQSGRAGSWSPRAPPFDA